LGNGGRMSKKDEEMTHKEMAVLSKKPEEFSEAWVLRGLKILAALAEGHRITVGGHKWTLDDEGEFVAVGRRPRGEEIGIKPLGDGGLSAILKTVNRISEFDFQALQAARVLTRIKRRGT